MRLTPEVLFEKNMRLAYHLARKWEGKIPHPLEDIIQECLLGLWKAAKGFDPEKGKFSTYAGRCMDNQVRMLCRKDRKWNAATSLLCAPPAPCPEDEQLDTIVGADIIEDFRQHFPLSAASLIDGRTQRELGQAIGYSQSYIGKMLKAEMRQAKKRYGEEES